MDEKGRLFIPAKLREGLNEEKAPFVLTRGLETCLYLFHHKSFADVIAGKLNHMPLKNQEEGRAFKRLLLAGAQEVEPDDLGRVLIPKTLSEFARIKKDVAILGVGERIELWSREAWLSYSRKAQGAFVRVGRHLEI